MSNRIHITLSGPVKNILDCLLTVEGFDEPARGSYSQFIEKILVSKLEETFSASIFDIKTAYDKTDGEKSSVETYLNNTTC